MDSKSRRVGDGVVLERGEDFEKWTDVDFMRICEGYSEYRTKCTAESVANFAIEDPEDPYKSYTSTYQLFPSKDKFVWSSQSELAIISRNQQVIDYDFKDQMKVSREKYAVMKALNKKHQCKKIRKQQVEMKKKYQEATKYLDSIALRIERDVRYNIYCAERRKG